MSSKAAPNKYRKYYSNSSEAYKVNPAPKPRQRQEIQKKPKPRGRRATTIFKYSDVHIKGISPYTAITIAIIFIGIACVVVSFAMIRETSIQTLNLHNELQKLTDDNKSIQADISENYDLTQIEKIATTKLGMSKPKPYQIVHINVQKQSYVVQPKTVPDPESPTGLFGKIYNFVLNIKLLNKE